MNSTLSVFRWVPPERHGQELTPYVPQTPVVWIRANVNGSMESRKRITDAVATFDGQPFSLRTLKTVALIVLLTYLSTAPNEESQIFVQSKICQIKTCLLELSDKQLLVVRPP